MFALGYFENNEFIIVDKNLDINILKNKINELQNNSTKIFDIKVQ